MSDADILNEMIKDSARVELSEHYGRRRVSLSEPQQNQCSTTICDLPENGVVIGVDAFSSPDAVFGGSRGECVRADYAILSSADDKQVIIYIEMKATRGTEKEIIQQLKSAQCFKVRDFRALMGDQRANHARLKSAVEFDRAEMGEGSELHQSVLRAVPYTVTELVRNVDGSEVLGHLTLNIANYYGDITQREIAVQLADYLDHRLETLRPEEASAARVLRELVKNQRRKISRLPMQITNGWSVAHQGLLPATWVFLWRKVLSTLVARGVALYIHSSENKPQTRQIRQELRLSLDR